MGNRDEYIEISYGRRVRLTCENKIVSIELINDDGRCDWGMDLSLYEAEKICLKLAELADLKVA